MKANQRVYKRSKSDEKVTEELQGSYGKTLVVMTSNPEELDILSKILKDRYDTVMDTDVLDNQDYAKVFVRKE